MSGDDFKLVRSAIRLSEYIGRFTQSPPKRAGGDKFMAFCPIHDNTNSEAMTIDDRLGVWNCFAGCGGGDIITFWMKFNNSDSKGEALRAVAADLSVTLPEREGKQEHSLSASAVKKVLKAVAEAAHEHLMKENASVAADAAYEYLEGREVTDDIMARWMIGALPQGRDATSMIKKIIGKAIPEAIEGGILNKSEHDGSLYSPFAGRILFPIFDKRGDVIGFGGREIPALVKEGKKGSKYINPTNNLVYSKAKTLYGEHLLNAKTQSVVVVEGYLDVIAVNETGELGVGVACCGTSLTSGHAEVLSAYPRVTALFDSDAAGQKALAKAVSLANHLHSNGYGCSLPEGLDPWDAFLKGDSSLAKAIEGAQPIIAAAAGAHFEVSTSSAFDTWVAEKLSSIESSSDRDTLLRYAAALRGRPVSSYSSTVSTIAVKSYSTLEGDTKLPDEISPLTVMLARRLFQLTDDERTAVTAAMTQWDDVVDESVSFLLPSAGDFDFDVIARVIAPGADSDPKVDAVLAKLMPHPDDAVEDISVILRNAINATLHGVNTDQDRWSSQVTSAQAMTLRRLLVRIDDVPSQTVLLAYVMDAALDASLSS
jgi:DNA primase catalytic core